MIDIFYYYYRELKSTNLNLQKQSPKWQVSTEYKCTQRKVSLLLAHTNHGFKCQSSSDQIVSDVMSSDKCPLSSFILPTSPEYFHNKSTKLDTVTLVVLQNTCYFLEISEILNCCYSFWLVGTKLVTFQNKKQTARLVVLQQLTPG